MHLKGEDGQLKTTTPMIPMQICYKKIGGNFRKYLQADANKKVSRKLAPYIKDSTFEEEKEYRLAIWNDDGQYDEYIRYRSSGHLQIPFVELRSGSLDMQKYSSSIRANVSENIKGMLIQELKYNVNVNNKLVFCRDNKGGSLASNDEDCFGCTMRTIEYWEGDKRYTNDIYKVCSYETGTVFIKSDVNVIMISQGEDQRRVFNSLAKVVDTMNNDLPENEKIKIWCEGHLPIRKIRVGNSRRKQELKEAITHFCKKSEYYWLRYVDVQVSDIPFRSKLNF
jgi:hypothetical protein